MKRMFLLLTAAAMIAASPALAGRNVCEGKLTNHPGGEWTSVINKDGYGCQFQTRSPIGKKITAACPNGSECTIEIELDAKGGGSGEPIPVIRYKLKDILSVDRD